MKAERAASSARWYAKRYGIDPGHLTREIFARLHLLPCSYCGKLPAMGVDHVLPLARGGTNALANLVAACLPCNQSKGASVA